MKILRESKLTRERWLNLFAAEYEHNGKFGSWIYATRRPTERPVPGTVDAVIIVPVIPGSKKNGGNKVVLASQYRIPIQKTEYSFPAGLVDGKESVEDCARRELQEETGYEVKDIHQVSPPIFSSAGMTDENCVMVFCTTWQSPTTEQKLDEAEDIKVEVLDLAGVSSLLQRKDYAISAKTWPILNMFDLLGKIEHL